MLKNLAKLDQTEMDKVNVDLAAAGVAFKERYNMPVIAEAVEREQPEHLRSWFRERLIGQPYGFGQTVTFTLRAQT